MKAQIELPQDEIDKKTGVCFVSICVSKEDKERHNPSKIVCAINVSIPWMTPPRCTTKRKDPRGYQHATATLIESIGPTNEITIVSYATCANVVLNFTRMTS